MDSPTKPKIDNPLEWNTDVMISTFFMVEPTGFPEAVNMKLTKVQLGEWTFTMLENTKKLKPWDRVMFMDLHEKLKQARIAATKIP